MTGMSRFSVSASLFAVLAVAPFSSAASQSPVTRQNEVTVTATIKAIDTKTRSVTLRSENGDEDTFTVGPAVTRLDQLKVGDTIKATYYESLVFQVRKPGDPAAASGTALAAGRLKDTPGGAIGQEQTTSVTVKAVDMNVPSITVTTADGRTLTRKIADKKNLAGVKPGDRIDITYTQAVVVSAETAKK
jgi:Cu/Ag efflux protein CusF